MKKFLTFLMILITAMGIGFAVNPSTPTTEAGLLPPGDTTAEVTFTFTLNAEDAAKSYAGFYGEQLSGANSVAKLESLSKMNSINTPIVYNPSTKAWATQTVVYATVGTNWIGDPLTIELTLNPFNNLGADLKGYTINCEKTLSTGAVGAINIANGTSSSITTGKTQITVGTANPAVISTTLAATGNADYDGQISPGGENGLLELKFTDMVVNITTPENYFKPTAGVAENALKEYKATWTFSIKAQ